MADVPGEHGDRSGDRDHSRADRLVLDRDERRAWALGAFHVAVLTVVALLFVHRSGALGDLLRGLDTTLGTGLYLAVWAVGWLATRAALARAALDSDHVARVLLQGVLWGGAAGLAVLAVVLLVVLAPDFLARGGQLSALGLVAAIGGTVALVAGMLVGGLLALLDIALVRVAARLAPTEP